MGGYNPTGEKVAEPRAGKTFWTINHSFLLIAIVAVISSAGFWEYVEHVEDDLTSLKGVLAKKESQIHDLTDELSLFRVYAIDAYGGDEKRALARLAGKFRELKELKDVFRPLDAPSRKKVVGAFRAVQTAYGTNPIQVELIAEGGNSNRNLMVEEWTSILKEAGLMLLLALQFRARRHHFNTGTMRAKFG